MSKVVPSDTRWMFHCPGCEHAHVYDERWHFNGSVEKPTFTPSLLVRSQRWDGEKKVDTVCHLYVMDGNIQFLADCTHKLAGKTVEMVEWENREA